MTSKSILHLSVATLFPFFFFNSFVASHRVAYSLFENEIFTLIPIATLKNSFVWVWEECRVKQLKDHIINKKINSNSNFIAWLAIAIGHCACLHKQIYTILHEMIHSAQYTVLYAFRWVTILCISTVSCYMKNERKQNRHSIQLTLLPKFICEFIVFVSSYLCITMPYILSTKLYGVSSETNK